MTDDKRLLADLRATFDLMRKWIDGDREHQSGVILYCMSELEPRLMLRLNERSEATRSDEGFRALVLREAAMIARESYPKDSEYDVRMKIAAGSIAGTLERMAERATSARNTTE